jgi:hypothetical protein
VSVANSTLHKGIYVTGTFDLWRTALRMTWGLHGKLLSKHLARTSCYSCLSAISLKFLINVAELATCSSS